MKNKRRIAKSKGRMKGRCLYFVWPLPFNLSHLGGPIRSIQTPVSINIQVNEVRNLPPLKGDRTLEVNMSGRVLQITKITTCLIYNQNMQKMSW